MSCLHGDFTCAAACETKLALDKELAAAGLTLEAVASGANGDDAELGPLSKRWRNVIGKPVSSHPSSLLTADMASFVNDLGKQSLPVFAQFQMIGAEL